MVDRVAEATAAAERNAPWPNAVRPQDRVDYGGDGFGAPARLIDLCHSDATARMHRELNMVSLPALDAPCDAL
jgi:hypothetical protein